MNIDQLLNVPQSADATATLPKSPAPSAPEGGARAFRETLDRAAGQGREERHTPPDSGDTSSLRPTKADAQARTEIDAPSESFDAADGLEAESDSSFSSSVTQAQLAWLLAQLASVTNQNGPALPVDGPGAAVGTDVHSTVVADLSRLVGAKALVATTAGTTGTPTPQATNEIAATNVEAQEMSALLTSATIQPIAAPAPTPAQTEITPEQTSQAFNGQSELPKPLSAAHPFQKASEISAKVSHEAPPQQVAVETPDALQPKAAATPELLSAATVETGAAENQAARGVMVRHQPTPQPRQAKVEDGPMVGDKPTAESGQAELRSSVPATGEGQEQQFEADDRESALTDRMQGPEPRADVSHRTTSDSGQVSVFSVSAQDASGRNSVEGKATAPASLPPLDVDPAAKVAGTPTIRFEVSPPEMGRVHLRVSVSEHSVYTNVITDQAGVRDLLLRQQDRLQEALSSHGLGMGSFNVEVGQQGQQRSEWGGQPDPQTLARLAADVPRPEAQTAVPTGWDERGLNLFA